MEEKFVVYCHCVRPSTGTKLTFPLPAAKITPETLADYVGHEFDWQFIPVGVQAIPIDQLNVMEDL